MRKHVAAPAEASFPEHFYHSCIQAETWWIQPTQVSAASQTLIVTLALM